MEYFRVQCKYLILYTSDHICQIKNSCSPPVQIHVQQGDIDDAREITDV